MVAGPRYSCPFPAPVLASATHPPPLPPDPFSGVSASHLSTSRMPAGGGGCCVPTEPHGLIFQDMGFTVYEHTFWDSAHLCLEPNMLLDVVEVEVPPLSAASPQTWFTASLFS